MATVGERVFQLRKELGMTQEELANKLGYKSKSTINKIEIGVNNIPQNKIAQFAKILGTTPAKLMGWNDEEIKKAPPLSKLEKELLDMYRQVSPENQKLMIKMLQLAVDASHTDTKN